MDLGSNKSLTNWFSMLVHVCLNKFLKLLGNLKFDNLKKWANYNKQYSTLSISLLSYQIIKLFLPLTDWLDSLSESLLDKMFGYFCTSLKIVNSLLLEKN